MNAPKQERVLVTGATGFIGRVTVSKLLASGRAVRVFARASSNLSCFEKLPIEVHIGDLGDPASVREAAVGVDVIVHAAGGGQALSVDALRAMNVSTTRAVRDAALAQGCRVVFVSSLAASGPLDGDEGAHIGPVSNYGRAKLEAEAILLGSSSTVHVTVLRPPAIYGPGDHRMLPVFKSAARGLIALPAPARRASFMHVDDCAAAIVSATEASERASGAVVSVTDGPAPETEAVMHLIAAALGTKARILRIPLPVLRILGATNDLLSQLRRRPVLLSRDKVRELAQSYWVADYQTMGPMLGFTPSITLANGMEQTARWYRDEGLL